MEETAELAACPLCGLIQITGLVSPGTAAVCPRCGADVVRRKKNAAVRTLAAALGGLFLYGPANYFPLVIAHYEGRTIPVTLWGSVRDLWVNGHWGVGAMVFVTSIATPALKLVCLFFLSVMTRSKRLRPLRTRLYETLEVVNPWNMLEIYMVAIVVSFIKFGEFATMDMGPGAVAFVGLVALTIVGYQCYDPRLVWDEDAGRAA